MTFLGKCSPDPSASNLPLSPPILPPHRRRNTANAANINNGQSSHDGTMALPNVPPETYSTPRFPSLNVQTLYDTTADKRYTLYYVLDVWRFTLMWTLVIYALFHMGAVLVAMFTHGWKKSSWKYLWAVPVVYLVMAGLEAVMAGSIVGLVLGAVYSAGYYEMNTWIPCTWGFINVLVLIISSFSIQGGL
ncbi:hypothetical protein EDB80DRAFT_807836 [Ilyonectria destructans]|nr:hypothetical protein EDB80DRAFT_807836 [Ilyonectria destructans]